SLLNESGKAQSQAVLQISSSLRWASVKAGGTPIQFTQSKIDTDIDHIGALMEAVVPLPAPVAPNGTLDLEIGYSGTVPLISNRLTNRGTPADIAYHSDWDRISSEFIVVRGIGYVAWYPITTNPVSLGKGNEVFSEIGRWKQRHWSSQLTVHSTGSEPLRLAG